MYLDMMKTIAPYIPIKSSLYQNYVVSNQYELYRITLASLNGDVKDLQSNGYLRGAADIVQYGPVWVYLALTRDHYDASRILIYNGVLYHKYFSGYIGKNPSEWLNNMAEVYLSNVKLVTLDGIRLLLAYITCSKSREFFESNL